MGLFKKKLTADEVSDALIQSLHMPLESIPTAPIATRVTRETVQEEVIFLQAFVIHLITSAKTPLFDAASDKFWSKLHEGGVLNNVFKQRMESYKMMYEHGLDPNGKEYVIGSVFANGVGVETNDDLFSSTPNEELDFFVNVGASLFNDSFRKLKKFLDSVKVVA